MEISVKDALYCKKVQLSGPISNAPDYINDFERGETICFMLKAMSVWNPAKEVPIDLNYNQQLTQCLNNIPNVDTLVVLRGWEGSFGAKAEYFTAVAMKKNIVFL